MDEIFVGLKLLFLKTDKYSDDNLKNSKNKLIVNNILLETFIII
jgi:hypothetical protein